MCLVRRCRAKFAICRFDTVLDLICIALIRFVEGNEVSSWWTLYCSLDDFMNLERRLLCESLWLVIVAIK